MKDQHTGVKIPLFIKCGKNSSMFRLLVLIGLQCFVLQPHIFAKPPESNVKKWHGSKILELTEKRPARTAILIIAPATYHEHPIENRWRLGRKVWEQYMNSHPNVDCYFLHCTNPRKDSDQQVWLEGNTIFVGDPWTEETGLDQLLLKTVKAIEWLGNDYTHYIRTNINTFFNLEAVNNYAETHHQSHFTTPLWERQSYTIGYAIVFTADVAAHIVSEYYRLKQAGEELIDPFHADDMAITALATGIWPIGDRNPFRCAPSLPLGIRQLTCLDSLNTKRLCKYGALLTPVSSLEEAIYYFDKAGEDVILFRSRDGLGYTELQALYEHMLSKIYPHLRIDLTE
jgi:hypothetical protein